MRWGLVLALMLLASTVVAWDQSPNARRVVPNDFWYNNWFKGNTTENGSLEADGTEFEAVSTTPGPGLWHLGDDYMNLERAWAITTGDPSLVMGILDVEVDLDHPDLVGNKFINIIEQNGIAGVDDDGNGLIDDISGWDFDDDDNDPAEPSADGSGDPDEHGTQMIGLSAAQGNNLIGGVGVVWDCQVVPMRLGAGSNWGAYPVKDVNGVTENDWDRYAAAEYLVGLKNLGHDIRVLSYSIMCMNDDAVKLLAANDILLVSGAGNSNIGGEANIGCSPTGSVNQLTKYGSVLMLSGVDGNYWKRDGYGGNNQGPAWHSEINASGYVASGPNYFNARWSGGANSYWDPDVTWTNFFTTAWMTLPDGVSNISGLAYTSWGGNWTETPFRYNLTAGTIISGDESIFYDSVLYGIIPSEGMTSGCAAQGAGLAMLLFSAYPELNHLQAIAMVERGTINIDSYNTTACGGSPCAGQLGYGRIDAYRTMTLWGTVNADTTFTSDVYVSGDVHIPTGVTVDFSPGVTVWMAPDDLYEGHIIGDGEACQTRYIIDDTNITAYATPQPSPPQVEFYVHGTLDLSGVTVESWGTTQGSSDWGGIWNQPSGTVTTDLDTQVLHTTEGNI